MEIALLLSTNKAVCTKVCAKTNIQDPHVSHQLFGFDTISRFLCIWHKVLSGLIQPALDSTPGEDISEKLNLKAQLKSSARRKFQWHSNFENITLLRRSGMVP